MYSKLPNLIIGFHGCDRNVRDQVVLEKKSLKQSVNDYDWLGHGIYFWEQNLARAKDWAKQQKRLGRIKDPAVIGAVIDLGHCLNLMDSEFIDLLSTEYKLLHEELGAIGDEMPKNEGSTEDRLFRKLDCAVIEHLNSRIDEDYRRDEATIEPFDSVRALFTEGPAIYENAGFKTKTHIQICIRNPNCIKAYFDPLIKNPKYKMP